MDGLRALLLGALVTFAVVAQSSLLAPLRLPGGSPQLLVVLVAVLGLVAGARAGMTAGFLAGVLADIAPPALHPLGLSALVLLAVGLLAGAASSALGSAVARLTVVALLTAAALLVAALLGTVVGEPTAAWDRLALAVPAAAAYDVVLALAVLPLVGALWHRVGSPLRPTAR